MIFRAFVSSMSILAWRRTLHASEAMRRAVAMPEGDSAEMYPVALPNYDEETATRLQIFLDNNDFGPGKIDGKMGEFFRKALISYKHAHAMPKPARSIPGCSIRCR